MIDTEKDCRWHFAEQAGGRDDGPNNAMEQSFKKTPYASLIREAVQNSLDVPRSAKEPVRVEFTIGRIQKSQFPNYFNLREHVKGCIDYYAGNDDARQAYQPIIDYFDNLGYNGRVYYIKVADYGTQGMAYKSDDTNNPFYAFVRAAGVSSKSDATAGGSFGYGKAAYFYISPLRSIVVSTMTTDGRCFFEGVASLCTHRVAGRKLVAVGYYDNNEGEPTTCAEDIPEKFRREEPGTDIYLFGIDADDREAICQEMTEAVLRNFWLAIYRGKLIVKVGETEIAQSNITNLMEQHFPDELDDKAKEKGYNPRPYLDAVAHAGEDKRHVLVERQLPVIGHVCFYAVKNKLARDKVLYMRRPMMLVKARRTQSANGFYGVFLCDDKCGNELLRKTENPAHNEWSSGNWRVNVAGKNKIVADGKKALDEVERFVVEAQELLFAGKDKEVAQIQGLEEFLYIPTAVEDDDDLESESLVGDIDEERDGEGNALSTALNGKTDGPAREEPAVGKVMIDNPNNGPRKRDSAGDALGGHGTRQKRKKGGGGSSAKRPDGHYDDNEDGTPGQFLNEVPVRYRAFAQMEGGETVHHIIIHSDYDIANGRIDLLVGGEQQDEAVTIKRCEPAANINGNAIAGLHIVVGRNVLKVRFADNMKHAVKLDAYEYK